MKRFLLLFLLSFSFLYAQDFVVRDGEETSQSKRGASVSQNGTNQYEYVTPSLRLTGKYSLIETFADGDYTTGNVWTVSSGAYVVDTLTNPLSSNKYNLKCTTAGIISIPCNQAYGVWKFQIYKGADANTFYAQFIGSTTTTYNTGNKGYLFALNSGEGLNWYSTSGSAATVLGGSPLSYVNNNTYYEIEIQRNTNGQTYTYITGGAFTTKTLVSVTGGSGTNPVTDNTYTSSNYFVLDLGAGDRIANISCEYGEGSLDLNSFERVLHSDNRGFEGATTSWTGAGNHSVVISTTDKKSGSNSLAATSTTAGDATTNYASLASDKFVPLVAGEKYTLEAWARGTGVLGSDLLTGNNSTFTSGVGNWVGYNNGTITQSSGLGILTLHSTGTSGARISTNKPITSAGTYYVSIKARLQSGTAVELGFGTSQLPSDVFRFTPTGTQATYSGYFVALTPDANNYLLTPSGVSNSSVYEIDDIIVKRVTLPTLTLALGSQTKSFTNISCVPGTFTKLPWNFQATANEVGQPLKMYVNQADVTYVDDVSLTQAWDLLVNVWTKHTIVDNTIRDLVSKGNALSQGANNGFEIVMRQTPYTKMYIWDGTTALDCQNNDALPTSAYRLITFIWDRTYGLQYYANGVLTTYTAQTTLGKIDNAVALGIGGRIGANYYSGNIGETQITKFPDIAQSNVNATTLTSAYKWGLPKNWVNGIPVFNVRWKGSTLTQAGRDSSPYGNHLAFVNVTIADIIFGQGYFIK